ncbi:Protein kinase domain-containing protein ppk32 [Smittium culicis]|uniref:Protein kinase domain-containing protein ppk32 n=1 Tax=Smittium culicis TaxID=133412 RepID=A0A1R1XZH0_9FUNG|nr:Protein kinase domain-containing protein ppk32 [Smittium culicis]
MKGIQHIINGLEFLHRDAKIIHTNISPTTILINDEGDWKISGFGYCKNSGNLGSYRGYDSTPSIPYKAQRNVEFSAPELILKDIVIDKNDLFSVGCILFAIHNNGHSVIQNTNNNVHDYEKKISKIKSLDLTFLESEFDTQRAVSLLINPNYETRISIQTFLSSNFFNNIYSKTLYDLENINQLTPTAQSNILRQVTQLSNKYPDSILTRKVLPKIEMLLGFALNLKPSLVLLDLILAAISAAISIINKDSITPHLLTSGKSSHSTDPVPILATLMLSFNYAANCLGVSELGSAAAQTVVIFLDNLSLIRSKLTNNSHSLFESTVLPFFYSLIKNGNNVDPSIAEKIYVVSIPSLANDIDKSTLSDVLIPNIIGQYKTTNKLIVKIFILKCFNTISSLCSSSIVNNQILPALVKTKSRNLDLVTLIVSLYSTFASSNKASLDILCKQVIPQCYLYLVEVQLTKISHSQIVNQISQISDSIHKRSVPEYDPQSTSNIATPSTYTPPIKSSCNESNNSINESYINTANEPKFTFSEIINNQSSLIDFNQNAFNKSSSITNSNNQPAILPTQSSNFNFSGATQNFPSNTNISNRINPATSANFNAINGSFNTPNNNITHTPNYAPSNSSINNISSSGYSINHSSNSTGLENPLKPIKNDPFSSYNSNTLFNQASSNTTSFNKYNNIHSNDKSVINSTNGRFGVDDSDDFGTFSSYKQPDNKQKSAVNAGAKNKNLKTDLSLFDPFS